MCSIYSNLIIIKVIPVIKLARMANKVKYLKIVFLLLLIV